MARADPGTLRFGAAVPLRADGWVFPACPHAGPSLAIDADGTVHAAWYTGVEGRQGLWYTRSDDRGHLVRLSELHAGLMRDTGIVFPGKLPSLAGHARGREMVWWEAGGVWRAGG